ncbi:MAG TPA: hypothetical protein VK929_08800 [Longimicrobiales bacterium]|nr:hypothetical protein [Longimicrobiales bacterium]
MSTSVFYRCAVWLPLLVPAAVATLVHVSGVQPTYPAIRKLIQVLLISGIYGGMPYAILASYATWWIDDKPEREIRRRALAAPLWMLALWFLCATLIGLLSGRVDMFLGLLGLGTAAVLLLGYGYVSLVFMLRRLIPADDTGEGHR